MRLDTVALNEYREIMEETEYSQFVKGLIDTFIEATPRQLNELRAALRDGDSAAFERVAHTLKSSGRTFGAREFTALAAELEEKGRTGDIDGTKDQVARCEAEYVKMLAALEELRNEL
jgi:HPt (histidine-containing phosphotransfer) domain-containing protein